MAIYKINNQKLETISEKKIKLEKDLQKITEDNLKTVFGLKFISTEFTIHDTRIDSLAFDEESNSFVIIEYKRDRSFSVVDQGFAYLSVMLNNKDSFILEFARKTGINLEKIKIDWEQSKILFLANSFTPHQLKAVQFKDLPFELWEVKKYSNNTILYDKIKTPKTNESIKTITKDKNIQKVNREVKNYTAEDHLAGKSDEIKEIFENLRNGLLQIDSSIEEVPRKIYIGYQINWYNVVAIHIYNSKIVIDFPRTVPKDLEKFGKVRLRSNSVKNFNQNICELDIKDLDDIDIAVSMAKEVYKKHFDK